jgi:hypothetical protein
MDTPTATGSGNHNPRSKWAKKPDEYHGDRQKLERWILQCDAFFHLNPEIQAEDQVVLITTYMRGEAQDWVTPFLAKYMDDNITDPENTRMFEEWSVFKDHLRTVFGIQKEEAQAERQIQRLQQTKSVAEYATQFQRISTRMNWDDNALKRMFRQGLKPQVRAELMRSGASINTLEELLNESIRIDNELYELELEERSFHRRGNSANTGKKRFAYSKVTRGTHTAGHYTSNRPEAMHLDNINREGKKWKKPVDKGGKDDNKTCYACGKPGHFARNCKSKNKVTRHVSSIKGRGGYHTSDQMLNVLSHAEEGNEENYWTIVTPPASEPDGNPTLDIMSELNRNPVVETTREVCHDEERLSNQVNQARIQGTRFTKENKDNIPSDMDEWNTPQDAANYWNLVQWHRQEDMTKHYKWESLLQEGLVDLEDEEEWWETHDHNGNIYSGKRPACGACRTCRLQEQREHENLPHPGTKVMTEWDKRRSYQQSLGLDDEYQRQETMDASQVMKKRQSNAYKQWNQVIFDEKHEELEKRERRERRKRRDQKIRLDRQNARIAEEWDATFVEYLEQRNQEEAELANKEKSKLRQTTANSLENRLAVPLLYAHEEIPRENYRYDDDYRNPTHDSLNWRFCYYDMCKTHYQAKWDGSHFPEPKGKCKWQWYDCYKDFCKWHLWDKRVADFFPGHQETRRAQRQILINGKCANEDWQVCMHPDCARHLKQKTKNGFDKTTFLDRIKWLNEPTPKRPDTDSESENYASAPEDATTSEQQGSSSSQ